MKKQPLRVGFDLDGVILYNPARVVRPLISLAKHLFLSKRKLAFYYPHSPFEKMMWKLFHLSSIYISSGMDDIKKLVKQKKIKAYIITARYGFMGPELMKWIKKNNLQTGFTEIYFNEKDEQPHLFKERMIQKLRLDVFVEDNWDIVKYLEKKNAKIIWIYNMFDFYLHHPYKFPSLKKAVRSLI